VRVGSICSGISADSVAWRPLGWRHVFFSEIEPYCCEVLQAHYPDVPNLGDMTKVDWSAWRGKVDVLMGSTPCQSFSVAGLRKSLDDARGNLTLEFTRAAELIQPRYIVWENVPGVLNAKDNPFGCLLGALVGADSAIEPVPYTRGSRWWHEEHKPFRWRWNALRGAWDVTGYRDRQWPKWPDAGVVDGPLRSAAWRCLDAQYFNLAQRRKRVFVVAGARGAAHPGEILFERKGVQRNSPPSRETGQGTAGHAQAGAGGSGAGRVERESNAAPDSQPIRRPRKQGGVASQSVSQSVSQMPLTEIAPTLNTTWGKRSPGSQAQEWDSEQGGRFVLMSRQPSPAAGGE
jgi:DNA (cytosine-5)-methyltransferase 1